MIVRISRSEAVSISVTMSVGVDFSPTAKSAGRRVWIRSTDAAAAASATDEQLVGERVVREHVVVRGRHSGSVSRERRAALGSPEERIVSHSPNARSVSTATTATPPAPTSAATEGDRADRGALEPAELARTRSRSDRPLRRR